jgi:lipid II:glycine glycyltransferase (peptidoglycan interpeptide bridge formation enzyme)
VSETVIEYLIALIRLHKINYVALQPDLNYPKVNELRKWGIEVSQFFGDERATLLIDLSQRSEALLREMRRTTRNNIRQAECRGIEVREGTHADLSLFYQLLRGTAVRRQFVARSPAYYTELWQCFDPSHHIKIFVAEYQSEAISSLLTIPFGDTVRAEAFGWSGPRVGLRPNELLIWKAIEWSKDNGYRKFDLGGIHISAARALLSGNSLPEALRSNPTRFKLGFGGSVVLLPPTFEYTPNRTVRLFLGLLSSILGKRDLTTILDRILSSKNMNVSTFFSLLFRPNK